MNGDVTYENKQHTIYCYFEVHAASPSCAEEIQELLIRSSLVVWVHNLRYETESEKAKRTGTSWGLDSENVKKLSNIVRCLFSYVTSPFVIDSTYIYHPSVRLTGDAS